MNRYLAYGLNIDSALPLPELHPLSADADADADADMVIRLGELEHAAQDVDEWGFCFRQTSEGVYLFWQEVGAFLIRDGKEVIISPIADVEERVVRLPLLGVISAILLHQRGFLVLHASAIAIDGQGVVFVGEKGQGKSTMAVTLYHRGHAMLSDDVVAIDMRDPTTPFLIPGFPQFKLWADTVTSVLGNDPADLPQLHPKLEKRSHRIRDRFASNPIPLKRIYVLSHGESAIIRPIPPQAALVQLITHSYVTRFEDQLLQGSARFSHFQHCAGVMSHVPIGFLERPRDLNLLPTVAALIEQDCTSALCPAPC